MKPIGIVYIIIGVVAILGALVAAFVVFTLSDALSLLNTATPADLPPGTDITALQESTRSLSTLITLGWVWIISVLLAGIISIYFGVLNLRSKKK